MHNLIPFYPQNFGRGFAGWIGGRRHTQPGSLPCPWERHLVFVAEPFPASGLDRPIARDPRRLADPQAHAHAFVTMQAYVWKIKKRDSGG